jgi:hypothetical protein
MKSIVTSFFALAISAVSIAQPPAGKAKTGDFYGKNISTENVKPLEEFITQLTPNQKLNVVAQATVTDVCSKKGCWITLAMPNGQTAFVKMKDYAFFVPVAAKGKTVVIEGTLEEKVTSVEELKHYAEDAKKPKAEIDAITEPKKEYKLMASGIKVI